MGGPFQAAHQRYSGVWIPLLWRLLPPEIMHVLPILLLGLVLAIGRQLPRDILERDRHRRPGYAGWALIGGVSGLSLFLLAPVYGAWGAIISVLLCLSIWKRFYYVPPEGVDLMW